MFRNFRAILWKNLLLRKKHWLLTATEIIIPVILFGIVAYGRSQIDSMKKIEILNPTYYDYLDEEYLNANVPVGDMHLSYAPYTNLTSKIVKKIQEKFGLISEATKAFDTKENLIKHHSKNITNSVYILVFHNVNNTKHLDYDISIYDRYLTWNTEKLFPSVIGESGKEFGDSMSSQYWYKGFVALQIAVNKAFLEIAIGKTPTNVEFSIQEFPYPPHIQDTGLSQLFLYFLPLMTVFSFIFLCPAVLQRVGEEKSSGTKEFLKMVGVSSWKIWIGWLIHALFTNLFSIIAIVILLKVPLMGVSYATIEFSDGFLLFVYLMLYCTAATIFCFFIGTLIPKPVIATTVGILIWILSYFLPKSLCDHYDYLSWKHKIMLGIFPNMAIHYGVQAISVYESRGNGLQWSNMFQSASGGEDDITMGNVFVILICDMIIFMLATTYLENIRPGPYGIAKPFYYPFSSLKKLFKQCGKSSQVTTSLDEEAQTELTEKPCVEIKNLYKFFDNTIAVDNLSMRIYENNITVFLGENGAGKTTTMSILTGMIEATKGVILVNGKNIKTQTDEIRENIGLCPQHNLLFPDLTVEEHLRFFAKLKNVKNEKKEISDILDKFELAEKKDALPINLSGGMKRKLCLGMAILGGSRVLVLDEPTSGMDPESRRRVWDLLLDYRAKRTIIITTHFMEEADVLGDYVAIMAYGKLQCYDTPMNLKKHYNTGYHLSILRTEEDDTKTSAMGKEIEDCIPNTTLLRKSKTSLVYLLPFDEKHRYSQLFKKLEDQKENLGIITMGINLTTLDDVFMKAYDVVDGVSNTDKESNKPQNSYFEKPQNDEPNKLLLITCSLFLKRWYFFKKQFLWYLPAFIVAVFTMILTLWLSTANNNYYDYNGAALNLDISIYGKTKVFYGGNNHTHPDLILLRKNYEKVIMSQKGVAKSVDDVSEGIIKAGVENIAFYKQHMVAAAEFNYSTAEDKILVNALYSSIAVHGIPISINLVMNSVIKSLTNDDSYAITTRNAPLHFGFTDYSPAELPSIGVAILWVILIPIAMSFFMSNFIIFPNLEISTNFIKIQTGAGVPISLYWFVNYIYDSITFIIKLLVLLTSMFFLSSISDPSILGVNEIGAFATIFLVFALTSLPFTYMFGYKTTISGGFSAFLVMGFIIGVIPTGVVFAMEHSGIHSYIAIAKCLRHFFTLLCPQFSLSYLCLRFSQKLVENFNWKYMEEDKRKHTCESNPNPCCYGNTVECKTYQSYYHNEKYGISSILAEMVLSFVIYTVVLLFLNSQTFEKLSHYTKHFFFFIRSVALQKDAAYDVVLEDIKSETKRESSNTVLTARNLEKAYGCKKIVKNLSMKLEKNKCFGLLGVNGAGKTTTFRMLTKMIFKDTGSVEIDVAERPILIDDAEYSKEIGYCPQEDYLNFYLTGRQLLYVIALVKGYNSEEGDQMVTSLLHRFGLESCADKLCLEYSGGNKRKLCTCIAFLGSPNIILLDEPTSGVDPKSRRKFWNVLSTLKKNNKTSFLLCSHSMEECENLCDEIGIMKDGKMQETGTLLGLKKKHQKGYKIEVKLENTGVRKECLDSASSVISERLKCEPTSRHGTSLKYNVDMSKKLSELFDIMEKIKKDYPGIDYSINDISLEDVFLSIAAGSCSEKTEESC